MRTLILFGPLIVFVASCGPPADPPLPSSALPSVINGEAIKAHIAKLAGDEMEGRAPAGKGADLATAYIADHFKSIGLKTTLQPVPLVGMTSTVTALQLSGRGGSRTLKSGDQFMAWTTRQQPSISVHGELVFAGFGTVAPEFQWNDFKESVKGKIVVVFINDPQLEDTSKFGGKAMTYYGRWTYKFEEAARQGAAGALIVHETDFAGYGWDVVRSSWSGEQFDMVRPDKGRSTVPLQGWITREVAEQLFKAAGHDFDELRRRSLQPDFKPVSLGIRASIDIRNTMRTIESRNVAGVLEGTDRADECVVFTAHWDHLGIGEAVNGDRIYNGATDNASGTAMVMDMARAFVHLKDRPRRSVVFLTVTAEEQGLLGSAYYAENPLCPMSKTVANVNLDAINLYGRHNNEMTVVGYGYNTLEDILSEVLVAQGRTLIPDREPEKGSYFRSDQFSLVKKGVPALYVKSVTLEDSKHYTAHRYHKPGDEYDPNWDMNAAVADGDALFQVALRVANSDTWPSWKPGAEFKAIREESLNPAK